MNTTRLSHGGDTAGLFRKKSKTPLHKDKETLWELLLDALSAWLLSVGVALAFDQLFRFHASMGAILLHTLLVVCILMLFQRRMWLLPVIVAAGLCLTAAILSAGGVLEDTLSYMQGFFRWWATLFPRRSPYSTAENILMVQWLIHIAIVCIVYLCVRMTHSVALIASAAGLLLFIIAINGFHENIPAMGWMIAGLFPLLSRSFQPRKQSPFQPTALTPLRGTRLSAMAVCAALALLTVLFLPANTSGWKWRPAANVAADIGSLLDLKGGNTTRRITLRSLGLQPYMDQLGGDIRLDDYSPALLVDAPHPALMKGRVYDVYTGSGWDAEDVDSYRLGSGAYDSEYRRAFDIGKPDSERGSALWQSIMTPVSGTVSLLTGGSTLYGFGRIQSLTMLDARNQPPMFNPRSEMFVQTILSKQNRYAFSTQWLNRNDANFSDSFTLLELEANVTTDIDYAAVQAHYTQLPETLPSSVRQAALSVAGKISSPYAQAAALESYLRGQYRYTLTPGDVPRGRDFVEYFLESGEGYCVYFASAMTVMARAVGLPARFVVGYGLQSNGDGRWIALQKNAHAWVECYFYGIGWVAFDPTAGSGYARSQPQGPGDGQPDSPTPVEPSPGVTDGPGTGTGTAEETTTTATTTTTTKAPAPTFSTAPEPPSPPLHVPWWTWLLIPALAVLLALLWLLWRMQTFRRAYLLETVRRRYPAPPDQAAYYYRDILRQLAILGYVPAQGETLLRFSQRILEDGDAQADLTPLFNRLMDWRYGEVPLTEEHVVQMADTHDRLEERVRTRLRGWAYFWRRIIGGKR